MTCEVILQLRVSTNLFLCTPISTTPSAVELALLVIGTVCVGTGGC